MSVWEWNSSISGRMSLWFYSRWDGKTGWENMRLGTATGHYTSKTNLPKVNTGDRIYMVSCARYPAHALPMLGVG